MRRILLITSTYTGAGHQSVSEALTEQFSGMPGVEVLVLDGFEMMGRTGVRASGLYGFLICRVPALYNAVWRFTMAHPPRLTAAAFLCNRRFMETVRSFHPDLILTVHSLFNTMVTRMLKSNGLDLPLVVLQADLVNIHSTWCNPEAHMTICPTREAYEASLRQGMPPEKLRIIGFPIRSRFCEAAREADMKEDNLRPLRCLLMSGSEGGNISAYAESVLEKTDAVVTIVCGRNRKLFGRLQKSLGSRYGERVRVLGFVSDMEQVLLRSDLLIARGSPNTLYEAVMMRVPVIMIGPLPAQEKDNPRLMEEHNLGVICNSPADAPEIIRSLFRDRAARLREIRAAQRVFRRPDDARDVAAYVAELTETHADL